MKRRAILLGAVAGLALGGSSAKAANFHGLYVGLEAAGTGCKTRTWCRSSVRSARRR